MHSLVSRPHYTCEERSWGHWYQFLILQAQEPCDNLHIFILEHMQSGDGVQDQENISMSIDLSPLCVWGVWQQGYIIMHAQYCNRVEFCDPGYFFVLIPPSTCLHLLSFDSLWLCVFELTVSSVYAHCSHLQQRGQEVKTKNCEHSTRYYTLNVKWLV